VGLGRVFEEHHAGVVGHHLEFVQVGRLPAVVHGKDCSGAGCDAASDIVGVEGEGVRADVGEHGRRPDVEHRSRRRDERHRWDDHLVPGTDVEADVDGSQGHGAIGHRHGMVDFVKLGERFLECGRAWPVGEDARQHRLPYCRAFLLTDVGLGQLDMSRQPPGGTRHE